MQLLEPERADHPARLRWLAFVCALLGAYLLVSGLLILRGVLSLGTASWLLMGLEIWGPYMYLLMGLVYGATAVGLWRGQNWARHAVLVLAAAGAVLAVPGVSSAVVDGRLGAIARSGLGVIVRVVVIWYVLHA